ncbi:MAG: efflux RND transporter periplasmic adaptor subunit [Leptolyngbyaceae cyanobacterium bins.59]|nr:efflux RND transporter periplasmic adaptor subunit [Leptolyngbyaceae cyanobacterium bins.59]
MTRKRFWVTGPVSWRLMTPVALMGCLAFLPGCGLLPRSAADAQAPQRSGGGPNQATPVDVAVARLGVLREATEYTGSTRPFREVLVRSQVEGQLLDLTVDVGDRVAAGQLLARLDEDVLITAVLNAEGELASRRSEIASAENQVSDARTQVEQARLALQQARADANRLQQLFRNGAISAQQAEISQTQARTAEQVLRSAQDRVRIQQQAIVAAQGRVAAQQAIVAQAQERRSYATIQAPIAGAVLARSTETGNLLQPGSEILRLGDFSQVKVVVQVSELELPNIRVGQTARVRLDALPNLPLTGRVARIAPAADSTARLIPVEVTIPNPGGQLSSGLLARVSFVRRTAQRVIVPVSALQESGKGKRGGPSGGGDRSAKPQRPTQSTVFVLEGQAPDFQVAPRTVRLGQQVDGKTEILSGLKPGDRFVVRSGRPLNPGDAVRLSMLSEGEPQQQK